MDKYQKKERIKIVKMATYKEDEEAKLQKIPVEKRNEMEVLRKISEGNFQIEQKRQLKLAQRKARKLK